MVSAGLSDQMVAGTIAKRGEAGWLKYLDDMFRKDVGVTLLDYNILALLGIITLTNAQ